MLHLTDIACGLFEGFWDSEMSSDTINNSGISSPQVSTLLIIMQEKNKSYSKKINKKLGGKAIFSNVLKIN